MPGPPALDNARTGTPDGSAGIQLATIVSQENGSIEIPGGVLFSTRIASSPSADRAGMTGDDTGTTDMSTSGFAGSSGANLANINNCGALVVWCEFANAAGAATVEIVFYTAANVPLFVSKQLTFTVLTQRVSASGDYMSNPQIIDTMGASKYRPYLRAKGTGDVDIFGQPV